MNSPVIESTLPSATSATSLKATRIQTRLVLPTVLKTAAASAVVVSTADQTATDVQNFPVSTKSSVKTSTPSLNVNVVVGAATTTQTISELLVVVFTVLVL
ncbi:hypothetical protein BCR33DRAFT_787819 [Rhizoclosmatium globosum]|uniref:Uncharacterized protein n=1 Tax=Rhizoclosmatium globosum TaxID=329046 RepID=A0A1Y2BYJ4_9FUNG|nr:hypothetical protein BCR33DRAFT_787819 [Rhizoclosmatium globosum]|eukprot:ORY39839.1 hypothetical protein BCR33DRAFT_787819 [Rhizoclosmatium globosum]